MNKHHKVTVALALFVAALMPVAASAATAQPKVVFIGDWLTDGWSATFPANWINEGQVDTSISVSQQMAAAIALKPAMIHVMIGSEYVDDDASYNLGTALLEEDLTTAITEAQAAHIPIFVGIEPIQFVGPMSYPQMDIEVYAIATRYGVPIINYSGAFSPSQTGYAGTGVAAGGTAQAFGWGPGWGGNSPTLIVPVSSTTIQTGGYSSMVPTSAGFAVMTMMAQTAFATLNAQPKSVYLQDSEEGNEDTQTSNGCCSSVSNVNTVEPGNTVQFYPVITYTNGVSGAGLNSNFLTGSNGTWTSSNPLVGAVNQSGQFWAFNVGTTTVKFTLPNGVWNEWIMYVN
jgi:hypothetical protein